MGYGTARKNSEGVALAFSLITFQLIEKYVCVCVWVFLSVAVIKNINPKSNCFEIKSHIMRKNESKQNSIKINA